MNPKNIFKKYFAYALIAVSFIIGVGQAKAAVPVVVFGDYLNTVHVVELVQDIDDADPNTGDIESFLRGAYEPTEFLNYSSSEGNTTVTQAQKLKGTFKDMENVIDQVLVSMNTRLCGLYATSTDQLPQYCQDDCPKSIPNCIIGLDACGHLSTCNFKCSTLYNCALYKNQAQKDKCETEKNKCISNCQQTEKEINDRKDEICNIRNNELQKSIALDVNIVKDTTVAFIEDLKNIAKEELGREQYAQIAEKLIDQYEQAGHILNYNDWLYQQSWSYAASDLANNFFGNEGAKLTQMSEEEQQRLIQSILDESLGYYNIPTAKFNPVDSINEIFDPAAYNSEECNGQCWQEFDLALQSTNNPLSIYLNARDRFASIKNAELESLKTQAIANQGFLSLNTSLTDSEGNSIKDLDGTLKKYITKPGSLIKEEQAAVTNQLLGLAASPQYAPPESAVSSPGEPLPPLTEDMLSSNAAENTIKWYDNVIEDTKKSVHDTISQGIDQCMEEADLCVLLEQDGWLEFIQALFDCIGGLTEWPQIDLNIPTYRICGYDICDIVPIPILCDF